jgi:uncharacterized membrane protein
MPYGSSGLRPRIKIQEEKMKKKFAIFTAAFLLVGVMLSAQSAEQNIRKPVIADRDLVIQTAEITENALFFPVDIDGVRMEVLAVKAPDGTIRTAFNTCQVCYASGRGYFVQTGTLLVCQNCGNRYRMSQVERQAGGCNPVPIFPANKKITAKTITVSKEYLRQTKIMFQR